WLAADQLHGDERGPLGLVDLVDDADGRVGQGGGGARLPPETGLQLGVMVRSRGEHLEGDLSAQAVVDGAVDDAHPTASELTCDPVTPQRPLRHPCNPPGFWEEKSRRS